MGTSAAMSAPSSSSRDSHAASYCRLAPATSYAGGVGRGTCAPHESGGIKKSILTEAELTTTIAKTPSPLFFLGNFIRTEPSKSFQQASKASTATACGVMGRQKYPSHNRHSNPQQLHAHAHMRARTNPRFSKGKSAETGTKRAASSHATINHRSIEGLTVNSGY